MINGTLLLQIINFYIGYILLKHIILRPALKLINHQDQHVRQLHHELIDLKNQASSYEEQLKILWQECAARLITDMPLINKSLRHNQEHQPIKTELESLVALDGVEKTALIEALAQKVTDSLLSGEVE